MCTTSDLATSELSCECCYRSQSDRGWVVLTLLTSMIPPSYELFEHCLAFLKGSSHPLAKMAENNLKLKKL